MLKLILQYTLQDPKTGLIYPRYFQPMCALSQLLFLLLLVPLIQISQCRCLARMGILVCPLLTLRLLIQTVYVLTLFYEAFGSGVGQNGLKSSCGLQLISLSIQMLFIIIGIFLCLHLVLGVMKMLIKLFSTCSEIVWFLEQTSSHEELAFFHNLVLASLVDK